MSSIDFGVDHKFYPTGRTPNELGVGFLVINPNSPSDFLPLQNVPPSVKTETLNPTASLEASREFGLDAHLTSFLKVHYAIDTSAHGELSAVKMVRERLNNISSADLTKMLSTAECLGFLKRISEEQSQRSKFKSWARMFFNMDPWLVVSTHTFDEAESTANIGRSRRGGGDATVPATELITQGTVSSVADLSGSITHTAQHNSSQTGTCIQPLVFAAKFRQVRYKLVNDELVSCYLMEEKPVPVGFFTSSDRISNEPIQSIEDIVAALENEDIEIELAADGKSTEQAWNSGIWLGNDFYIKAESLPT